MSSQNTIDHIEQRELFELSMSGPENGNPFLKVSLSAEFSYQWREYVHGELKTSS